MTKEILKDLESVNELRLTDEESGKMLGIFEAMAAKEAVMAEYNTDDVEVMVHVMPLTNVFREDNHVQRFSRESLLEGSPEHTEDSWQVPRLVK